MSIISPTQSLSQTTDYVLSYSLYILKILPGYSILSSLLPRMYNMRDDFACLEESEGDMIHIIHAFCSPGWEERASLSH